MKFKLNDHVIINGGNESGRVVARAEYSYAEPSYLVRYVAADGRAAEVWWTESALTKGRAP